MSIWDEAQTALAPDASERAEDVWDSAELVNNTSSPRYTQEFLDDANRQLQETEVFNAPLGQRYQQYQLLYPRDTSEQELGKYEKTRDDIMELAKKLQMPERDIEANYPEIKEQEKTFGTLEPGRQEFFGRKLLRGFLEQTLGGPVNLDAATQETQTIAQRRAYYTARRVLDGFKGAGHLATEWLTGRYTLGLADALVDPANVLVANTKLKSAIEGEGYTVTDLSSPNEPLWRLTDKDDNVHFLRPNGVGDPEAIESVAQLYDKIVGLKVPEDKKRLGDVVQSLGAFVGAYKAATKLVGPATLPKGIGAVGKAAEAAKVGAVTGFIQEGAKGLTGDEDYEGAVAVLENAVVFAGLSLIGSGVSGVWDQFHPTERAKALKMLGLKRGATKEQVSAAVKRMSLKYHPDKVAGMEAEFKKVIEARDVLYSDIGRNVIMRGRPPVPEGKGIAGLLPMGPQHEQILIEGQQVTQPRLTLRDTLITPTETQALEAGRQPNLLNAAPTTAATVPGREVAQGADFSMSNRRLLIPERVAIQLPGEIGKVAADDAPEIIQEAADALSRLDPAVLSETGPGVAEAAPTVPVEEGAPAEGAKRYKGMVDITNLVDAAHNAHDFVFTFGEVARTNPELYSELMGAYGKRNAAVEKAISVFDRVVTGVDIPTGADTDLAYVFEDKRLSAPKKYAAFMDAVTTLMEKIETQGVNKGLFQRPFTERLIDENNQRLAKIGPTTAEAKRLRAENANLSEMRYLPHTQVANNMIEAKVNRLSGKSRTAFLQQLSAHYRKRKGKLFLQDYVKAGILDPKDVSLRGLVLEALEGYYYRSTMKSMNDYAAAEGLIQPASDTLRNQGWHSAQEIGISAVELKDKLVHPMYARALNEMIETRKGIHNPLRRIMSAVKIGQFIKPTIIWVYNGIQKFINGIYLLNPLEDARLLAESFSDVMNKTAIYHQANEANLFQFPYEVSNASKRQQIELYVRKHSTDINRLMKMLETTTGQSWQGKDLDLIGLLTAPHLAVGNLTWFGDKVQRLHSYKVLRRMGYSHADASNVAAHSHGAYSILGPRFKKWAQPIFFVYSFRILMPMRIAQIMAQPLYEPMAAFFKEGSEAAKKVTAKNWRRWVKAWVAAVALPVLIDEYLESKGFEKEGKHLGPLAWKWKKTVVLNEGKLDESTHEVIIGMNDILNMPVKYWNRLTYYNPIDPKSRAHQAWSNFWKWEIHPLWRIFFWDLADNKRSFGGSDPVYDPSVTTPKQLQQIGTYVFGQSWKFWNGVLDAVSSGEMTDAEATRQKEVMDKAIDSWDAKLLSLLGYAYVRMPMEERQAIMTLSLRKEHRRRVLEVQRKYPAETEPKENARRMKAIDRWFGVCTRWIDNGMK